MIWLLIGYIFLYVYRPFEIWPVLASFQLERVFIILVLVAALITGNLKPRAHILHAAIFCFAMAVSVSWIGGVTYGAESSQRLVVDWSKVIVFYLLVVSLCNDRRSLELLITGLVAATGLYVLHSVYEYQMGKHSFSMGVTRLQGINKEFAHPNSFATVSLVTMPYAFFLLQHGTSRLFRTGALVYIPLVIYGVLMSSSRTGIVGIVFLSLFLIVKSKHKTKILAGAVAVCILAWPMLPESKQKRILSLYDSDYAADQKGSVNSADGRMNSFWDGVELFGKHPLIGAGPDARRLVLGSPTVSHNLYGQLLGEVGLIGSICFAMLILICFSQAWRLFKPPDGVEDLTEEDSKFFSDLAITLLCVFCIMLLFGMAGGTLFRFYWIWNTAIIVITVSIFRDAQEVAIEDVPKSNIVLSKQLSLRSKME